MVSETHPTASIFLLVAASLFLVVYALPLLIAPLRWARVFLWKVPAETDLTVYLGRCLGAVAVAICAICFRAAPAPEHHVALFEVILVAGALLTLVHIWGALRRVQPWTEHVEIALYAALTGVDAWVLSTLS
ncbi:MAG: hypothetical protein HYY84_07135 [Deltaproteobacteria bacterium]|nr:hypothetical protein [Deltaproteobacteria bacterium]